MHPIYCERLVRLQLEEAKAAQLFSDKVELVSYAFPLFYVRFQNKLGVWRLLQFEGTNYDTQPLAVDPVDPETKARLPRSSWLRRGGGEFPLHPFIGDQPFLCVSGVRDFYTFPGHRPTVTGSRWEEHRSGHRIPDLIRHIAKQFASGQWE